MKPLQVLLRYRNPLLLVTALGLGGLAAFGARGYIAEQLALERERLLPRQETVPVVVAKRDLARGETVSADTMAVREIPREYLPASAIAPDRFEGYVGTRLSAPMRAGEPLLHGALEGADVTTFATKVRSGIRALTIAVDEVNSLSGMLQPGDRIDILLSVRLPSGSGTPTPQEVTRPLMQDLRVLATGRQVRPGGDERQGRNYTAITVEVTPEQAQKLVVAQRNGKLTAMLRNPEDRSPLASRTMDVYGLLDLKSAPLAQAHAAPPEIIVGGQGALKPNVPTSPLIPAPPSPPAGAGTPPGSAAPVPQPPAQPATSASPYPPSAGPYLTAPPSALPVLPPSGVPLPPGAVPPPPGAPPHAQPLPAAPAR